MKKRDIVITIFLVIFSISFFFGLSSYYEKPVIAEDSCPLYMTPNQCLEYLEGQLENLNSKKDAIQNELDEEEYQQLSLNEKIAYIRNQITQTENDIKSLEIKISAHNVEIELLEENIKEMEESVAVLGQEISTLEASVNRKVTESYKYSFVGPLELFLDTKNFSSILRKSKYLAVTRLQERESLRLFNTKVEQIKREEDSLAEEKAKLQETRNILESEKIELAESRNSLASQKAERERLLAESKAKEVILASELKILNQKANEVTAQITNLLLEEFRSGQIPIDTEVKAGDIIGFQGHTGFAYGSHLHLNWRGSGDGPLALEYFKIKSGRVYGDKAISPLGEGAYLTQGYHAGYSLDMVGLYNWNYQSYYVGYKEVCCTGKLAYMGCV
ncbi:MAG TPA: hypothetical protein P5311_03045, partial [Candidatus Dojkabacteria bacterium]|nr:hypothetical protein [Candidatus Dojkabacteria bacterium]